MQFKNPTTSEIVEINHPATAVLLFGPVYFFYRRIWIHGVICLALMGITWGISNIFYAYFATDIIKKHFDNLGWKRIFEDDR